MMIYIFLDPGTDPWPGSGYNSQTQTTIDAEIGNGNYDIGHLVDCSIMGIMVMQGVSDVYVSMLPREVGLLSLDGSNWSNDLFVIDYLPHEMGHRVRWKSYFFSC